MHGRRNIVKDATCLSLFERVAPVRVQACLMWKARFRWPRGDKSRTSSGPGARGPRSAPPAGTWTWHPWNRRSVDSKQRNDRKPSRRRSPCVRHQNTSRAHHSVRHLGTRLRRPQRALRASPLGSNTARGPLDWGCLRNTHPSRPTSLLRHMHARTRFTTELEEPDCLELRCSSLRKEYDRSY